MRAADRNFSVNITDQATSSKRLCIKKRRADKAKYRTAKSAMSTMPRWRFLSDNRSSGQPEILGPPGFRSRYPGLDPGLPGMKRAGCLRLPEQFVRLPISALLLVAKIVRLGGRFV